MRLPSKCFTHNIFLQKHSLAQIYLRQRYFWVREVFKDIDQAYRNTPQRSGCMDLWTDRQTDGWINGWKGGWTDEWMDRQVDGSTDRRMDGWMIHIRKQRANTEIALLKST